MTSGPGQVRSAQMAAYPAMLPYRSGWTALQEANPEEAARQGMVEGEGQRDSISCAKAGSTCAGFRRSRASRSGTTSGPSTRTPDQHPSASLRGRLRLCAPPPGRERSASGRRAATPRPLRT